MRWSARDPYAWRSRFALFPRRIGNEWVWLECFEWRYHQFTCQGFDQPPLQMIGVDRRVRASSDEEYCVVFCFA